MADPVAPPDEMCSDQSLLRLLRSGDRDAALALYRRYAPRVRELTRSQCPADLASRFDPEDIVQSVFRCFFHDARRGLYQAPAGTDLWRLLVIIALNKLRARCAYHRAACRDARQTRGSDTLAGLRDVLGDPADDSAYFDLLVREALKRLPLPHRDVVTLRLEGHSVTEVSGRLGRSKRTVERLLQECRGHFEYLLAWSGDA
jgi:RNA polymerase sigma-70 factor, ECF subfamily